MAKHTAPKVPGQVDDADASGDYSSAAGAPQSEGDTVAVKVADLNALTSRLNALEAAAVSRAQRAKSLPQGDEADLPDASTVDAKSIDRAVLTKTGWVVPLKIGFIPGNMKN